MLTDLADTISEINDTFSNKLHYVGDGICNSKTCHSYLQHPSSYQMVVTVLFFTSFKIMLTAIKNAKELPIRNLANIGLITIFHQ